MGRPNIKNDHWMSLFKRRQNLMNWVSAQMFITRAQLWR